MTSFQPRYAAHDHVQSHIAEFCAAQLIYVAAGKAGAKQDFGNPVVFKHCPSEESKPRFAEKDSKSRALIL